MNENSVTLEDIISSYDELDISSKRKELGIEITELTVVVKKLLNDILPESSINVDSLEEFENLYNGQLSEGEYLTGLYEDVINFKDLLAMYLDRITSIYYEDKKD